MESITENLLSSLNRIPALVSTHLREPLPLTIEIASYLTVGFCILGFLLLHFYTKQSQEKKNRNSIRTPKKDIPDKQNTPTDIISLNSAASNESLETRRSQNPTLDHNINPSRFRDPEPKDPDNTGKSQNTNKKNSNILAETID